MCCNPPRLPGNRQISLAEAEELLRGIKAQEKRKRFHQLAEEAPTPSQLIEALAIPLLYRESTERIP